MKEEILIKLREFFALFLSAVKCEWAVVRNAAPEIIDNLCGSCIYCWIMRKIGVVVGLVILLSIDPLLGIVVGGAYAYFARRDFAKFLES